MLSLKSLTKRKEADQEKTVSFFSVLSLTGRTKVSKTLRECSSHSERAIYSMEFKEAFIKCLSILGYKPSTIDENVLYSVNRGFPTIMLEKDFETSLKFMYVEQNPLQTLNFELYKTPETGKPYISLLPIDYNKHTPLEFSAGEKHIKETENPTEYMLRGLFKPCLDLMSDEQGPSNS